MPIPHDGAVCVDEDSEFRILLDVSGELAEDLGDPGVDVNVNELPCIL